MELSRPLSLGKIGDAGFNVVVRATPGECEAVARRMDIPAIHGLTCAFTLTREERADDVIVGMGHLHAQVTRVCVISMEEFAMAVEDHFEVRFVPAGEENGDLDDPDREDEIPYEGDSIDLGEATAEQLALALDPYPRMDNAMLPETEGEDDRSPFSALARRKESKKDGG